MIFLKRIDLKKPPLYHPSRRKELEKRKEILSPVGKQLFKMAQSSRNAPLFRVRCADRTSQPHALKNDLPL
jgi:hypothetical protein